MRIVGRVAQSVEQRIENPCVGGSIPPPATTKFKGLAEMLALFYCLFFLNGTLRRKIASHHITQHKNYTKQSNPFLPKSLKNNQVSHCCPNTTW